MGILPPALSRAALPVLAGLNRLPSDARQWLYARSGVLETVPERAVGRIRAEAMAGWIADRYPRRSYPAAAIGSASGALVHLCAAIGMPFLPQSCLVPVRQHGRQVDDADEEIRRGRDPARRLLEANPDVVLHQMQDPSQDRLMLSHIRYFRLKWRRLPQAYADFLVRNLAPGATLLVSDCRLRWPVTRVGDRHVFQFGGHGGLSPDQYRDGSPLVRDFLARSGSPRRRWDPPAADVTMPEAEWGFDDALLDEVRVLADVHGWRVQRLVFEEADDLSAPVADLHRWWWRRSGRPADRMIVESFGMLDPWSLQRSGSVPFWLEFPVESAAAKLERYLDGGDAYDEIRITAFPHGIETPNLAGSTRWQDLAARARSHGALLGIDAARFPRDLAAFLRFGAELRDLDPVPDGIPPLTLAEAEAFLRADPRATWIG
jgi:hypothetical protein